MPSPSGPPHHASTRLGAGSTLAAALGVVLWSTLTTGHPLGAGSPFSLCALVLAVLCVLLFAALPPRPGADSTRPVDTLASVWMPWSMALVSLLTVSSEPGLLLWLWPLLLLPLTALALAFLATRAHRRPVSDALRGYPTATAQSFGTAAVTTALVSLLVHLLLTNATLIQSRPSFSLVLFMLVAVFVVQVLLGSAPAPPPRIAGPGEPSASTVVLVWLAWPMVPLAALPAATHLVPPVGAPSLWPLGLFPLGALGFAVLSTRGHLRERAAQVKEAESA